MERAYGWENSLRIGLIGTFIYKAKVPQYLRALVDPSNLLLQFRISLKWITEK